MVFYICLSPAADELPTKYGHYSTAFRRLKKWMELGVWRQMLNFLISKGYFTVSLDKVAVDSN